MENFYTAFFYTVMLVSVQFSIYLAVPLTRIGQLALMDVLHKTLLFNKVNIICFITPLMIFCTIINSLLVWWMPKTFLITWTIVGCCHFANLYKLGKSIRNSGSFPAA